jgi:hypothetical protein
MKIQSNISCFTTNPQLKWLAGEIKEVSKAEAELLLKNKNFAKVEAEKVEEAETEQEEKTNESYRKTRSTRNRA